VIGFWHGGEGEAVLGRSRGKRTAPWIGGRLRCQEERGPAGKWAAGGKEGSERPRERAPDERPEDKER
jgi:hypothetical protein